MRKITHGDGKGEYLLPVTNTSAPVDLDMLNNIMRLPERQRFAIIINELGVGLAGNGRQLNAVIRRADPALYQLDRVLAILASQNSVLADLARDSDAALAPAARESQSISDFIDKAGATATATASRGDALEQNFEKFPAFLIQLRPTMRRLGEFAQAGTPVMTDLRAAAPSVNTIFKQLGPFSEAALPTFVTLGNLADTGREALPAAEPVDQRHPRVRGRGEAVCENAGARADEPERPERDPAAAGRDPRDGWDDERVRRGGPLPALRLVPIVACVPYAVTQNGQCGATFGDNPGPQPRRRRTPPADALAAAAASTDGSASLVDESAPATTDAGAAAATGAPAGSGVLNYLLGGSSER